MEWWSLYPKGSSASQSQISDLTTTVSTTRGSTPIPERRERVQGKTTLTSQDLRALDNKDKNLQTSSPSTPNYPTGWLTSKITKREVKTTLPFPVSGDNDDEIRKAVDQFRTRLNGAPAAIGQSEDVYPSLPQGQITSSEGFHRELKRAKPPNLPGQICKGRVKLHPTFNPTDPSNTEESQLYYFCRTKSPLLWHVPEQDPMCNEVHRLLRPWTNGTFTL